MDEPERLTIDTTAARDLVEHDRCRHVLAVELFALEAKGKVEIALAGQGHRLDVPGGKLAEKLRALVADERVAEPPQLAYPSPATLPCDRLLPGAHVPGFVEAWEQLATGGKKAPGYEDRLHVETHLLAGRDVFITDDRRLITVCRRLQREHGFSIDAMKLEEYLKSRRPQPPPDSETSDSML